MIICLCWLKIFMSDKPTRVSLHFSRNSQHVFHCLFDDSTMDRENTCRAVQSLFYHSEPPENDAWTNRWSEVSDFTNFISTSRHRNMLNKTNFSGLVLRRLIDWGAWRFLPILAFRIALLFETFVVAIPEIGTMTIWCARTLFLLTLEWFVSVPLDGSVLFTTQSVHWLALVSTFTSRHTPHMVGGPLVQNGGMKSKMGLVKKECWFRKVKRDMVKY